MADKFEVRTQAERFIHNELSNCAHTFSQLTKKKFETGATAGVAHDMIAALIFTAFSIEAKINFIGWRTFKAGWPERASTKEKVELLLQVLSLNLSWGERPLQTINQLKRFRDTIAHGKPEIVDNTTIVDVEPEVWDALKSQWQQNVTQDFVNRCREDEGILWNLLLEAADIPVHKTLTSGGHQLSVFKNVDD